MTESEATIDYMSPLLDAYPNRNTGGLEDLVKVFSN